MHLYDLTAVFSEDLPVYANDPGVGITETYRLGKGHVCNLSMLTFGSHTGTHIDTPKHFIDSGATCDTIAPDYFFGPTKVLDLRRLLQGRKVVEAEDLTCFDIEAGDRILLNTGCSPLMRDKNFHTDYVSISLEAAAYLVSRNIKMLGIDYLSVETFGSTEFNTHKMLLGHGVVILEGLVFDNAPPGFVPQGTYLLSALPLKIKNGNGSPVRAVLADDRKLDLAIFDMDGLMLDTEPISVEGWQEAGRQLGYTFTPELFDRLFGCGRTLCQQRMEAHFGSGFDFEMAYAIRTDYTQRYIEQHGVVVKPGLFALLDLLDELGIKKCVATSTDRSRAEYLLRISGLESRFDAITGGDSVVKGKPDPEIFLTAAAAFHVPPRDCIVLEDSITGAEAAYNGGMRALLVPDLSPPDKATLGRVSAVCRDLNEAAAIIKAMKKDS